MINNDSIIIYAYNISYIVHPAIQWCLVCIRKQDQETCRLHTTCSLAIASQMEQMYQIFKIEIVLLSLTLYATLPWSIII